MVYFIGPRYIGDHLPSVDFVDFDLGSLRSVVQNSAGYSITKRGVAAFTCGAPLGLESVPKIVRWKAESDLSDFVTIHGAPVISEGIRSIVEEREPNVHQFLPVTLIDEDDRSRGMRFIWIVCNEVDSVDRTNTNLVLEKGVVWRSEYRTEHGRATVANPRLVLNLSQIGSVQFWRDRKLLPNGIYASDGAAEHILDTGFIGVGGSVLEAV